MQANRLMMSVAALLVLAGCGTQRTQELPARKPAEVKAEIVRLLPAKTADRQGWATDIYAAFAAQNIHPIHPKPVLGAGGHRAGIDLSGGPTAYRAWARSPARKSTAVPTRRTFPACW